MTKFILALFIGLISFPSALMAASGENEMPQSWLSTIEAPYVCMVNNQSYKDLQIKVMVDDKAYYGCCMMCKGTLESSSEARTATDPISGNSVDKATAIIGKDTHRRTYYFENAENFALFAAQPMPEHISVNTGFAEEDAFEDNIEAEVEVVGDSEAHSEAHSETAH